MDPMQLLWIAVAIVVVLIIVALVARSAKKRRLERDRADAETLRAKAHEHDHDLRDRAARADEADAAARRAQAEADAKAAEARRLQAEADKRSQDRDALLGRREEQLREADRLDPDVRTDKEGRRLDGGRSIADDRAEWDRPAHDSHTGERYLPAPSDRVHDDDHEHEHEHVGTSHVESHTADGPVPAADRHRDDQVDPAPDDDAVSTVDDLDTRTREVDSPADTDEDLTDRDHHAEDDRVDSDETPRPAARYVTSDDEASTDDDRSSSRRSVHVYDPSGPSGDAIVGGGADSDAEGTRGLHRVDPPAEDETPPASAGR